MRNIIWFCLVFCIFASGCVINSLSDEERIILLNHDIDGIPISIEVQKGKNWVRKQQLGPIGVYVYPQFVFWLEDSSGNFIRTLYITGADGVYKNHAGKRSKDADFFRESFPLWAAKIQQNGIALPTKEKPYPDSVTSATPFSNYTLKTKLSKDISTYSIWVEMNSSGDGNEYFPVDKNQWIGQPAIVYRADVDLEKNQKIKFQVVGHSGVDEAAGVLDPDLSKIDTAFQIVKLIEFSIDN